MSGMRRSVEAAKKLGMDSKVHWWANDVAVAMLGGLLERLRADPERILCVRLGIVDRGTDNERITLWHYTSGSAEAAAAENGDDGEDTSWPCPPFYPPAGPPCP